MFAFLAAHRAEVFPDADYADLFSPPGVGRPSVPATQMAAVLTLQALCDYSDRETAGAVRFDVQWKAAIGAGLDDPGFDPSTLVYWRRRLAGPERRSSSQGNSSPPGITDPVAPGKRQANWSVPPVTAVDRGYAVDPVHNRACCDFPRGPGSFSGC